MSHVKYLEDIQRTLTDDCIRIVAIRAFAAASHHLYFTQVHVMVARRENIKWSANRGIDRQGHDKYEFCRAQGYLRRILTTGIFPQRA